VASFLRNIKLTLAYDGTCFCGWQKQAGNALTIQGLVEEKIALMTGSVVVLHGAGRTDAGVHALGMVASFTTSAAIPCQGMVKGLNSMLPEDVRILKAEERNASFHARYNAVSKTYLYQFFFSDILPPTKRLYWTRCPGTPDLKSMKHCLGMLVGEHDFSSFEASGSRDPSMKRGAVRTSLQAPRLTTGIEGEVCMTICGDGFLRHMVRNIAGTLIEVGRGRITVENFESIFSGKNRSLAGPTAPARGLFLKEVAYDKDS